MLRYVKGARDLVLILRTNCVRSCNSEEQQAIDTGIYQKMVMMLCNFLDDLLSCVVFVTNVCSKGSQFKCRSIELPGFLVMLNVCKV